MPELPDPGLPADDLMAQLRRYETLHRLHRALATGDSADEAIGTALEIVLETFRCDRAFLLQAGAPGAPEWILTGERTRPEHPGLGLVGDRWPIDPELTEIIAAVRQGAGPTAFGPGAPHQVPPGAARRFGIAAILAAEVAPRHGPSYLFGLHHCAAPHDWSADELETFRAVAELLADCLGGLALVAELAERERRLREAEEMAAVGHWERDLATERITASVEACRIFGLSQEAVVAAGARFDDLWRRRLHPADRRAVDAALEQALAHESAYELDYRIVLPGGEVRRIHSRGGIVRDATGRPRRVFGTVQDVTVRRLDQHSLELFRALLDQTTDAIEIVDPATGRYLDVNARTLIAHGYERDEFLRLSVRDVDPLMGERDWQAMVERLGRDGSSIHESVHMRKDGSRFPVEVNVQHVHLETGDYLLAIVRDISERKRLEEELVQAQKMEAVGRLAGGIAHDFNNLLTVINGYAAMLAEDSATTAGARELALEVHRAGNRAAELTRQLLAFSRKQVLQPRAVDLAGQLRSSAAWSSV